MRYAAHNGKFVFLREIKGKYRICTGVQSRSRSLNADFYERMFKTDSDGFEKAVEVAKKCGTLGDFNENDIRTGFYVRLALNLLNGGTKEYSQKVLESAFKISKEKTLYYIDLLPCESESKSILKEMLGIK